jgi:hypothetical protein
MPRWNPLQPPEDGLPPDEVRFMEVRVEPWPEDGRKVRVHLQITPFIERPNIEVIIKDPSEEEVASIYIVESIDDRMTFTMHIRGQTALEGTYSLIASLNYPEAGNVAQEIIVFQTPITAE